MHKSIAITLLMLYMTSSFGVVIVGHYCCGHFRSLSVSLNDASSDKSSCCSMAKVFKGCCKDRVANYKVTDVHKTVSTIVPLYPQKDAAYEVNTCYANRYDIYAEPIPMTIRAAPPGAQLNIYLLICVWRV